MLQASLLISGFPPQENICTVPSSTSRFMTLHPVSSTEDLPGYVMQPPFLIPI